MIDPQVLERLAGESGGWLGELGVRAADRKWIEMHAEAVASLARVSPRRRGLRSWLYRLARRAAATAR